MFIQTRTEYFLPPPTAVLGEILCNNLPPGCYSGGMETYWEAMLVSAICKLAIQHRLEPYQLEKWKSQLLNSCITCIPVFMAKLLTMSVRQEKGSRKEPD